MALRLAQVTGDSDEMALVVAAQQGDKRSLGTLLDRHWSVLLGLCRRALGEAAWAEEAAQEAALQALLSITSLRRTDRFGAWLGGIGLNVCRSWLRQRRREGFAGDAPTEAGAVASPDWRADPEVLVIEAEVAERLRRAVAELPPGQRVAVTQFYLSGLTHRELAGALGIPVGAVKTRLHKARTTLRRKLSTVKEVKEMPTDEAVDMRIADVRRTAAGEQTQRNVVVLDEVGGSRRLGIWVGLFEGAALALNLAKAEMPRPGPYQLMANLLGSTGTRLKEVRIERLAQEVFYAVAVLQGPGGKMTTVDARPSDALNLALLVEAPVRVSPAVLRAAENCLSAGSYAPQGAMYEEGTKGAPQIAAEARASWTQSRP